MFASDLRSSSTKLFDKFTDSDDGLLYVRPGTETGTKTDTKTETKPESEVPSENLGCWVCGNKFKNQIGLQTHMNKHWRENVSLDENYNIKSSFNQRQLYITKSNNSLIKDINEPVDYILDEFKPFKSYKYKVTANCLYKKRDSEEEKTVNINFRTDEYMTKYHRLDLNQWLDHVKEIYEGRGYDYEFIGITDMQISIERTKPSLGSYIELPLDLKDKTNAILNIRNNKFNCLRLCITAALHPAARNATRENKYIDNLVDDWEDNEYAHNYLTKIQNKYNINIWFYRPIPGSAKVELLEKCIDFVKDRKNVRILTWGEHCALIKNIEVLLERPNAKHAKFWFCDNCTYWFSSQHKYETHECCVQIKPKIVCPKLKQIKFKNQHKQQEVKNVIFADIECYMKGTDQKIGDNTHKISEHVPIATGYNLDTNYVSYFGSSCIKDFVKDLLEIESTHSIKSNKTMVFTEEDKQYHNTTKICHICNKPCINKVRDHCHQTGRYRGPACNICNLNYRQQNFIPVIFHNGKGYDFNLLFNELFNQNNSKRRVDILPSTNGKARMFRIGVLKFIDSYSFMTMSLEKMANIYGVKSKTLYPYEYFKDENSYNNKLGNLSIQDFRSSLTTKLPTQADVDSFNNSNSNKTGKELTLEYMENDIFILQHCFNLFVKLNINTYKLNPLHYISLPGYSFDCFLKLSEVDLDTIQDEQMLKDFIGAMRGGICGVFGNRKINKNENRKLWYIDANNLYGYALMQKLPYKDFSFSDITIDEVLNTDDDSDYGYWLICDLEYTNECKDKTAKFQSLPHKREVENNELGCKQRPSTSSKSEKLVLDQNNKYEYPIHYRMLKFVVKMGIKVTKVHRIIKFKQDYIIRDYIELNTKMRAEAKIEPEKDIFKLMNNSLFGKSCENPLKYLEAKILTDDYEILKAVSKPTCKDVIRYDNYTLIEFYKKEIQNDKPIYLGSTVLELSKLHMYEFFYNVLQPSLKDLMLHYMDTDSFVLSFTEGSIDNKYMDLSNVEVPIKTNNKVPGKFKHELGSKEIEEFIVLKPKTYSFKHFCAKEKGIKKENNGKHEDYYNALMDDKE